MDFKIRNISSLKDVSEVIKIHNQTWNNSSGIIDLLENGTECFILDEMAARKIVGYLFVEKDESSGFFEINDMAIDPAYRGKGCGKILMKHALSSYDYIKLNANSSKKNLIEFYEKLGFTTETVLENYYSINEDALRMVWKKNKKSNINPKIQETEDRSQNRKSQILNPVGSWQKSKILKKAEG